MLPPVETVAADESETIQQLEEQFQAIQNTTSNDYDHAVRAVHAKAHGIAKGTLTVRDGLPTELAQGLFATPGSYDAILRISTNAGDILDDDIALPRGLALKVMGVEGERLPGSEDETSQDFILVNGPVFAAPDAKAFLKNLTLLAKTTDRAEGAKKILSSVLQATDKVLTAVGIESPTIRQLGGAPQVHPLGETYYSQTPFLFGDHIVKWQLAPVSPELTSLAKEVIDIGGRPERDPRGSEAWVGRGRGEMGAACPSSIPTSTRCPSRIRRSCGTKRKVPSRTVATLEVPAQIAWEHGESDRLDDVLSFNIWHGLTAHRPLGGINRARNETYRKSAGFRHGG